MEILEMVMLWYPKEIWNYHRCQIQIRYCHLNQLLQLAALGGQVVPPSLPLPRPRPRPQLTWTNLPELLEEGAYFSFDFGFYSTYLDFVCKNRGQGWGGGGFLKGQNSLSVTEFIC